MKLAIHTRFTMTVFVLGLALFGQVGTSTAQQAAPGTESGSAADAMFRQAQAALDAKRWAEAEQFLAQAVAAAPTPSWHYLHALGRAQLNQGKYQAAVQSWENGLALARQAADASSVEVRTAIGEMLTGEGNAYLKLKQTPMALERFAQAADMSSTPGVAFFNVCATLYNLGNMDAAIAACTKAIALEPQRADAHFIKGSALFSQGTLGANNTYLVPGGTIEALRQYLALAPTGAHARDVREMLEMLGVK
jgi:tetratricopeptide (TPR) repeat protein